MPTADEVCRVFPTRTYVRFYRGGPIDQQWTYPDIASFLLIAEAVVGAPAETLAAPHTIARAESALAAPAAGFGEFQRYETIEEKAAVLCSRIVRNHPLPDGNERTAFLCMLEFLAINGWRWPSLPGDPEETASLIERLAAGEITEAKFTDEIRARIEPLGAAE